MNAKIKTIMFATFAFFLTQTTHVWAIDLTEDEQSYIANQKTLIIGNKMDWAPFDYAEGSKPMGYSIDLMRLIAKKTGLKFKFVNGFSWAQLMSKFRAGEIDILPAIMETSERLNYIRFTPQYYVNQKIIVVRSDQPNIQSIDDLNGRKLAVIKEYYYEQEIRDHYPNIEILPILSFKEGLDAVLNGKADAFIGSRAVVLNTMRKHLLTGLKIAGRYTGERLESDHLKIGVSKDQDILLSILTKGMEELTNQEKTNLANRWIGLSEDTRKQKVRSSHRLKFKYAFDIGGEPGFSIIQDRDGFLWFSSFFNGLVRYDGTSTKKFLAGPNSLSNDFVTQIHEDKKGRIWVGTNSGLTRYDKSDNSFKVFRHDPNAPDKTLAGDIFNLSAKTIIQDQKGTLWFGTQNGLSRLNEETDEFTNYRHKPEDNNSLSDNNIFTVFEDSDGMIWVGAKNHGVNRLDPATGLIKRFRHDPDDPLSLPDDEIQAIVEDSSGTLWMASRDKGLISYNRATERFKHIYHDPKDPESVPDITIWDIRLMKNGTIALIPSSSAVGLIFFDPKKGTVERFLSEPGNPYGITTNTVHAVFEDRNGIIWVVHNNGKVDKTDPSAHNFNLYKHIPTDASSLASNAAIPIYEDQRGTIWIGLFGAGLDRFNPTKKNFTHFTPKSGDPTTLPHGYPAGFYEDDRGNFIVSTAEGMVLFDGVKGKVIRRLSDDTWFYTMIQDNEDADVIWAVGWEQSFNRFNWKTGERKVYKHDPDDPKSFAADTSVRFIRDKDNPNFMWIATWGGGLEKFDKQTETFKHHKHDPDDITSISSNTVFDVYEDTQGNFWVATGHGFNKFDKSKGTFKRFSSEQGFQARVVHNIHEDKSGRLWMGTNIGLVVFDIASETVIKVYTKEDGLHSHDFFATARGNTKAGQLWFGGFNGLNSFVPEELKDNKDSPQIYLTSVQQAGEELRLDKAFEKLSELNLDWRDNSFEFEYVALNFTNSIKNRYQYFLEGYDKDWFYAGKYRFGRYSSLPGGKYVLRIRGSNNDGIWSQEDQEVRLIIRVASPPWQTWWAYIAYVLMLTSLMYFVYKWRISANLAYQKHLETDIKKAISHIESSINYASNIQRSLLPNNEYLADVLKDFFVIWEPRDVVSGDLYWYRRCEGGFILVLADCTGHGVPGAFMTMLASGSLDRALREQRDGDPAKIISLMHKSIQHSLGQECKNSLSDDGLELGICKITNGSNELTFAGARFSLYRITGEGHEEIKGDKSGIGYHKVASDREFTNYVIANETDTFVMASDGIFDQIGGEKGRGFGRKRFLRLLNSIQEKPLEEQKQFILKEFSEYQGDESRRDDISAIGFKCK